MLPLLLVVLVAFVHCESKVGQDVVNRAIPFLEKFTKYNQKKVQETFSVLEKKIEAQAEKLQMQEQRINGLLKKNTPTVAFLAGYDRKLELVVNDVIPFSNVKLNHGNAYNKDTGVFTAPVDGLYYFHLFAMTATSSTEVQVSISVNDEKLATLYTNDVNYVDQGSASLNVILKAGQKVMNVVHYLGNSCNKNLFAYPYTGFLGHLIKAI